MDELGWRASTNVPSAPPIVEEEQSKEFMMAQIADLQRKLTYRDIEIAEKKVELEKVMTSFRTVIALKNREIKDLRDVNHKLRGQRGDGCVFNEGKDSQSTLNDQMKNMSLSFARMEDKMNNFIPFIPPNRNSQTTMRVRFDGISKLDSNVKYSHLTNLVGIDWKVGISKVRKSLKVELTANNITHRCSVFFKFHLISHKSDNIVYTAGDSAVSEYNQNGTTWGYDEFISIKDLFDEKKRYVQNDSIIVSTLICAFPSSNPIQV